MICRTKKREAAANQRHRCTSEQAAIASTPGYLEICPHNLPERSTVNVEISPLLRRFIRKFRRIVAHKRFYGSRFYEAHADSARSAISPTRIGVPRSQPRGTLAIIFSNVRCMYEHMPRVTPLIAVGRGALVSPWPKRLQVEMGHSDSV